MSLIEFPYISHKGHLLPIIPFTIPEHRVWAVVDSGAAFSILAADDAHRINIDWREGVFQMIVVGDGSFIPTYIHESYDPNRRMADQRSDWIFGAAWSRI